VLEDRATAASAASAKDPFQTKWLSRAENLAGLSDPVDRRDAPAMMAQEHCAGYGFERKPELWLAGREHLQQTLRLRSPRYARFLPLPEPVKEIILASKLPGRCQISVESLPTKARA
jgi:hypothetical protein